MAYKMKTKENDSDRKFESAYSLPGISLQFQPTSLLASAPNILPQTEFLPHALPIMVNANKAVSYPGVCDLHLCTHSMGFHFSLHVYIQQPENLGNVGLQYIKLVYFN